MELVNDINRYLTKYNWRQRVTTENLHAVLLSLALVIGVWHGWPSKTIFLFIGLIWFVLNPIKSVFAFNSALVIIAFIPVLMLANKGRSTELLIVVACALLIVSALLAIIERTQSKQDCSFCFNPISFLRRRRQGS